MNNRTEYDRLRRQIDLDYQKKVAAIDMVWSMVQEMTPEFSDARAKRGAVTVAVRECVATMDGNFTWNEIKDAIEASDPNASPNRTTISQILKKMANSGKLEVIEIGIGKRPTRYVAIRTSLPVP